MSAPGYGPYRNDDEPDDDDGLPFDDRDDGTDELDEDDDDGAFDINDDPCSSRARME